jgi:hypothetical protein
MMSPSVPEGTNSHKAFSMLFSARNPPTAACFESMTLLDAAEPQVPVGPRWGCVGCETGLVYGVEFELLSMSRQ